MRTVRIRTYRLDPRYRHERHYTFVAERVVEWRKSPNSGRVFARKQTAHGSTPRKAQIALAKARTNRREAKRPISSRDLADERRYLEYLDRSPQFNMKMTPTIQAALARVLDCNHDWQETHPAAKSFAFRCHNCGARKGSK